jgi:hypothetical protein
VRWRGDDRRRKRALMPLSPRVADFLLYFALCTVMTLAGAGVLRLLRLRLDRRASLLFAPVATQTLWVLAFGIGVALRTPVRFLAVPVWAITLLLAGVGCAALARGPDRQTDRAADDDGGGPLYALCVVLPILVLLPYFMFGLAEYTGSRHPDTWTYSAYAEYIWSVPRGGTGLSPLHRYATHLANSRHVGSSELGFLSVLTSPGDTSSAIGLFLGMAFFVFAAACASFARAMRLRTAAAALFVILAVLSGWSLNALLPSNFDNIVALSFFPALALTLVANRPDGRRWWLLTGLLLAALLYTYPDVGVLVCVTSVPMFAERLWRDRAREGALGLVILLATVSVLLSPYVTTILGHFRVQMGHGLQAGPRPGDGLFEGLVSARLAPTSVWALGGEFALQELFAARTAVGLALFGLFGLGVAQLIRARQFGLGLALGLPLLGAPVLMFGKPYAYGAYKMLLMGWWIVAFATTLGATAPGWSSTRRRLLTIAGVSVCLSIPAFALARGVRHLLTPPPFGMSRFRAAEQVAALVGRETVGLFVPDGEASMWAAYFLRGSSLWVGDFEGYLDFPHTRPLLAQPLPPNLRYLLTTVVDPGPVTEAQDWTPVWQGGPYRLWKVNDGGWAIVTEASTPNGFEQVNGAPFFWMGGGASRFHVVAGESGCLRLTASISPGPSVRRTPQRIVTLEAPGASARRLTLETGRLDIGVPVQQGITDFTLRPDDAPDATPSGADPRPLILGVSDLRSRFEHPTTAIVRVENPNGLEHVGDQAFLWLGGGPTVVLIDSDVAGVVALKGTVVIGPSTPSAGSTRRLQIQVEPLGFDESVAVAAGPWSRRVPVAAGRTAVRLQALDPPTVAVQPNGDRRPLVVGLSGLGLDLTPMLTACQ